MSQYMSDTVGVPGAENEGRTKVLREIYSAATAELREKYAEEFNKIRARLSEEKGVAWSPRPTEEDKARQQLEDLKQKHPALFQ